MTSGLLIKKCSSAPWRPFILTYCQERTLMEEKSSQSPRHVGVSDIFRIYTSFISEELSKVIRSLGSRSNWCLREPGLLPEHNPDLTQVSALGDLAGIYFAWRVIHWLVVIVGRRRLLIAARLLVVWLRSFRLSLKIEGYEGYADIWVIPGYSPCK